MFVIYSLLLTIAFIVLLPRFLFDAVFKGKYAAGFKQRLGFVPGIDAAGRKVLWLHCVSVGEVNAARPLAWRLKHEFPDSILIVSTTTRTGQELARTAFADIAEMVFYFPFDWKSTVRRSLRRLTPSVVLLVETELWFNFIRETNMSGSRVAIVNGRLSERSFQRFCYIKEFVGRVFKYIDLALMQDKADATRMMSLGLRAGKVKITGNLKFDYDLNEQETRLTTELRDRFDITTDAPLIIAASTHSPEESWILDAFKQIWKSSAAANRPRLMIVPRHPERFAEVAEIISKSGFTWARRSSPSSSRDRAAGVILLDSIGELRAAYPLAQLVFVGGSLVKHGGQSIFEPAAAGKAIIIGPHTANFEAAVKEFMGRDALLQLAHVPESEVVSALVDAFIAVLSNREKRNSLQTNALGVMKTNRGAVALTVKYLSPLLKAGE